jgi:hypothetical protein
MALSGSYDFTLTRDTCIDQALAQLGVLGEGETPTAAQYADDAVTLNLLLKSWQNKEVAKALMKKFYVFLEPGKRDYLLSTTVASSDHSSGDFYYDTLGADYADGGTTLTVTTGTGATDADELLVVSDSNTLLTGDVESGGGTTTLTVPDLNGDAESGNGYFALTTRTHRPLDILWVNRAQLPTEVGEDTTIAYITNPLDRMQRSDWAQQSAKGVSGTPSQFFYEELNPNGILHIWPEPITAGEFLECWGQFTIDDMDSSSDNFNLPSKWYGAVMWNLALWLTPKYGASDATFKKIATFATSTLDDAEYGDSDDQIEFAPDFSWRR